jgi:hypothetical protein
MAAIGCVGKQVLRQVARRQPQVAEAFRKEAIAQGGFGLPPTERAVPARRSLRWRDGRRQRMRRIAMRDLRLFAISV